MGLKFTDGSVIGALTIISFTGGFVGNGRSRGVYLVRCTCGWQGEMERQQVARRQACVECQQARIRRQQGMGALAGQINRLEISLAGLASERGQKLFNLIISSRIDVGLGDEMERKHFLIEALDEVQRYERSGNWGEAWAYWRRPAGFDANRRNTSATGLCMARGEGVPSTW